MSEAEYKQFLSLCLGNRVTSLNVQIHDWGTVPRTFQTSSLSQSQDHGIIEGLPYDIAMEKNDIPAYIQFIQDSIALEKRRPTFTQHKPRTLDADPEYVSMLSNNQSVLGTSVPSFYKSESVFSDSYAFVSDYRVSVDSAEQFTIPEWCQVITGVDQISDTDYKNSPILLTIHPATDMKFLETVTASFKDDFTFLILYDMSATKGTMTYRYDTENKLFQKQYTGTWKEENLVAFLGELLQKEGATLLELENGTLLKERDDGFWKHMLETVGPSLKITNTLTLRKNQLILSQSSDKPIEKRELTKVQKECLETIFNKVPENLSLEHCFQMFKKQQDVEKSVPQQSITMPLPTHIKTEYNESPLSLRSQVVIRNKQVLPLPLPVRSKANPDPAVQIKQLCMGLSIPENPRKEIYTISVQLEATVNDFLYKMTQYSGDFWYSSVTTEQKIEITECAFLMFLKDKNSENFTEQYNNYCRSKTLNWSYDFPESMAKMRSLLNSSTEWLENSCAPPLTRFLARLHIQLKIKPSVPLFRTIVCIFSQTWLEKKDGMKLTASEMWSEFQKFLRTDSEYPAYSTSQQADFNETLQSYGFEQKRTASGKVWCDTQLKQRV